MADRVVQHWEDFGAENTPTAANACLMQVIVEGVAKDDGSGELHCTITTTDYAVMDNCRGGCKVGLLDHGTEVASYIVESPRNPARGFVSPTVRSGTRSDPIPTGIAPCDRVVAARS